MTAPMENPTPTIPKPALTPMGWKMALEKAPQFLSVLLIFTLPFLTQMEGQNPLFPKFAVTQIIVYFILGAWTLRVFLTGRLVWISSRALWVISAFLLWAIVSQAYSPYSKDGFLQMKDDVIYPLWYVLLTFTCLEAWQAENLLVSFLISGFVTVLWALAQLLGVGGDGWTAVVKNQYAGRPVAGLGSPDFLAGFLEIVWPLSLALMMRANKPISFLFWGLIFGLSLDALFLTGSLGGWVGLVVGTIVFSFYAFKDQGLKAIRWFVLPLLLITGSFFVAPMSNTLKGFLTPPGESVQFQRQVWRGAILMIQERPLLGFGYGTFSTSFPSRRPPFLGLHQPQQASAIDHASNWFLEWTAETGIIGTLLMMVFWFYVLAQWWKLYAANAVSKPLVAGIFAAVAGVAADNLLDMNSYLPTTCIPLLFLAAFPVALSQRFYRMEGFPIQRREADLRRWKIYLLPVLTAVMALVLQRVGDAFQRQGADLDMKRASAATSDGKWDKALNLYDKALKLDPGNVQARYFQGSVYLDRNQFGDMEKALDDFDEVEQVMPDYKLIHYQKYGALLRMGKETEAKEELKHAIRSDPMLVYLLDDYKKARGLAESGHLEEALIIYQNLYFDYPTCVPMMVSFANCFAMAGNFRSAIDLYQQALQLDPQNDKARNNLEKVMEAWKRSKQTGDQKANVLGGELE